MFGFGAERKLHWAVLYVGYAFLNIVTAVASIAMTYVIESYFEVAAEALLLVNAMKNVVGWGFTYGFVPWTVSAGYETVRVTFLSLQDESKITDVVVNRSLEPWRLFSLCGCSWLFRFISLVQL